MVSPDRAPDGGLRRLSLRRLASAAAAVTLVACTGGDGDSSPSGPAVDDTTTTVSASTSAAPTTSTTTPTPPTTISTAPTTTAFVPAPGSRLVIVSGDATHVLVEVPFGEPRGVPWLMDRWSADGTWTQHYAMNAGIADVRERVFVLGEDVVGWEDLGVSGTGPDPVPLPDGIEAGTWRLCPNVRDPFGCVSFDIVRDDDGSMTVVPGPFENLARSYLAFYDVGGSEIVVAVEFTDTPPPVLADLEVQVDDGSWMWTSSRSVDANGTILVPAPDERPHRLCFPALRADVACVIVPPAA